MNRSSQTRPLLIKAGPDALSGDASLQLLLAGLPAKSRGELLQAFKAIVGILAQAIHVINTERSGAPPATTAADLGRWQDDGGFN